MRKKEIGRGMDETLEATIYAAALRQTTLGQRHAMAEALAQAETLLEELTEAGRYAREAAPKERESDRLHLALALMRARRGGFEDGTLVQAWWRESVGQASRQAPGEEAGADLDGRNEA